MPAVLERKSDASVKRSGLLRAVHAAHDLETCGQLRAQQAGDGFRPFIEDAVFPVTKSDSSVSWLDVNIARTALDAVTDDEVCKVNDGRSASLVTRRCVTFKSCTMYEAVKVLTCRLSGKCILCHSLFL